MRADHLARVRRDAALARVGSITKGIGVASVAAVAVIGIYISRAVPGHSTTPAGTGAVSGGSATAGTQAGGAQAVQPGGLAPPDNPPTQTQQQAPVVSGST